MATRKMSKEVIRSICEAVIDRRFYDEYETLKTEKHKIGEKVQELFDNKYGKLYQDFPELFDTRSVNILERYKGSFSWDYVVVSLRMPTGFREYSFSDEYEHGYNKIMTLPNFTALVQVLEEYVEKKQKLEEKRSRAFSELRSFVSQYTTIKKLLEAAPELSEYLDIAGVKVDAETGNALTVTYDSVKDLIVPLRSEK